MNRSKNKTNTHSFIDDSRNQEVLIYINGDYFTRADAKVSVFDSGFLLGDGVWEGIRLHNRKLLFLDEHIDRLLSGAVALSIDVGLSADGIKDLLYELIRRNNMSSDVHIRLIVSRGIKTTPYQHPDATCPGTTVVAIPEYKRPLPELYDSGIALVSVETRRGDARVLDPRINSLNKLNCILACIEADRKGADEGLMLDLNGNISTCNSTNFFFIKDGELCTSGGSACLNGITRSKAIELARGDGICVREDDFRIEDVYSADEIFVTGTFAGILPATSIDGRDIPIGPITGRIRDLYTELVHKVSVRCE